MARSAFVPAPPPQPPPPPPPPSPPPTVYANSASASSNRSNIGSSSRTNSRRRRALAPAQALNQQAESPSPLRVLAAPSAICGADPLRPCLGLRPRSPCIAALSPAIGTPPPPPPPPPQAPSFSRSRGVRRKQSSSSRISSSSEPSTPKPALPPLRTSQRHSRAVLLSRASSSSAAAAPPPSTAAAPPSAAGAATAAGGSPRVSGRTHGRTFPGWYASAPGRSNRGDAAAPTLNSFSRSSGNTSCSASAAVTIAVMAPALAPSLASQALLAALALALAAGSVPLLLGSLLHVDVVLHNRVAAHFPSLVPFPRSALPTHSGYLVANATSNARLFYAFYEAQTLTEAQTAAPVGSKTYNDTPLVLWLQGGPGCSSMIGNFYELGPWRVSERLDLEPNPAPWNARYGVLFVDNPVGTGFSVAEEDAHVPTDQAGVVAHLYEGLCRFFDAHPHLRPRPFFLAGESYAGKYVPGLGQHLVEVMAAAGQPLRRPLLPAAGAGAGQRAAAAATEPVVVVTMAKSGGAATAPAAAVGVADRGVGGFGGFRHPFRLDGVAVGNGLVDPRTQVQTHADTAYYVGVIDDAQREKAAAWAQRVVEVIDAEDWGAAYRERTALVDWIQSVSGLATLLDNRRERAYHYNQNHTEWLALFLNRPQVKKALRAEANVTWVSCCPRVCRIMSNDTMKSTRAAVERLLSPSIALPVLLYQGLHDLKDGAACSEAWMRRMEWGERDAFFASERAVWRVDGEVAGYWRQRAGLTHVVLKGAGHEVPADQPVASQRMLETWIEQQLQEARDASAESAEASL